MKKIFLTTAIIASLGLGSALTAQSKMVISTDTTEQVIQEFTKIEISALPEVVVKAVAKDYEGSTIKEAFENKEAKLYKVVITVNEKDLTVVYDEKGEVKTV